MTTALDVATNLTGAAITEAQEKTWFTAMRAALAEMGDPTARYAGPQNLSIACSVGASALTIALKTRAAADADANNPISVPFRNVTSATGDFSVLNLTAAHSLVISSGSTMGATNSVAFRLWLVEFNDAGTLRLGAVNCLSGTSILALKDDALYSSTAEGGAGGADSAQVIYTGTAVASKALRIIGYLEWSAGLAAVGTWGIVPTKIQLFGPGVPLPGSVVQIVQNYSGAAATGSTLVVSDDTIPQNTEGDQYLSLAITPTSATSTLIIQVSFNYSASASVNVIGALFQDTTASAIAVATSSTINSGGFMQVNLLHKMTAGTTSATTFKFRAGSSATITMNGAGGARRFGGVYASSIVITEVLP